MYPMFADIQHSVTDRLGDVEIRNQNLEKMESMMQKKKNWKTIKFLFNANDQSSNAADGKVIGYIQFISHRNLQIIVQDTLGRTLSTHSDI